MTNRDQRRPFSERRGHDKIGAVPLGSVGNLSAKNPGELRRRHIGTRQHALALEKRWRRYHQNGIAVAFPASLEQQRHIEHDKWATPAPGPPDEGFARPSHHRMQDRFETPERRRVAENQPTKRVAIEHAARHGSRESLSDRGNRRAVRSGQNMDIGIGIEHRDAIPAQHLSGNALTHAD